MVGIVGLWKKQWRGLNFTNIVNWSAVANNSDSCVPPFKSDGEHYSNSPN